MELAVRECRAEIKNMKFELENKIISKMHDLQMEKVGEKDDIYSIKN